MNVEVRDIRAAAPAAASRLAIADCDLHLGPRSTKELFPFLSARWRHHIETYGLTHCTAYQDGAPAFPKSAPMAARRDAWAPNGSPPGTDLAFIRSQHLDAFNVQLGLINPPQPSQNFMNADLGNAMSRAINDWQIEALVRPEPRLRASIVVNYEDPAAAVEEIERCAGVPGFGHVLLMSRTSAPLGQRRYFPIFAAAAAANIPVAMHAFGFAGHPSTSSGWPSFYLEDMLSHAQSFQAHLTSLVFEGVFARLPNLRFVMIEGGFGWLPSLSWRLDKLWARMRDEVPQVTRPPSEYIRQQLWLTTQPMEEPEPREHVLDAIEWIGWDRLLYASDYPHWDFDDPDHALPLRVSEARRQQFFFDNAQAVYGSR
jgi:predicted TIM-barrel fold metal-dependent hydrolase